MLDLFERLGFQKEKLILTTNNALTVCLFAQITSDIWLVNDLLKITIKYLLLLLSILFSEIKQKEIVFLLLNF